MDGGVDYRYGTEGAAKASAQSQEDREVTTGGRRLGKRGGSSPSSCRIEEGRHLFMGGSSWEKA